MMSVAIGVTVLTFCVLFITYPLWKTWMASLPVWWQARRDMRQATRNLIIRNGWIVEYGRDRHIAVLHCGHCPNYRRLIDMTGRAAAMAVLVDWGTKTRCTHQDTR